MKTVKNEKGFTLVELLTVFAIMFIIVAIFYIGIFCTVFKGNFWYTQEGVLKKIQLDHPKVVSIINDSRNIWRYSKFTVEENEGRSIYYVDTNVLFNYEVHDSED